MTAKLSGSDGAAPLRMSAVQVPNVYAEVARRAGKAGAGSVMHLPAMTDRENLLYQTVHRQKQVESITSAIPLHTPVPETEQEQLVAKAKALLAR